MHILLFLGLSLLAFGLIAGVAKIKGIALKTVSHLFLFGMALSIPFIMVEHMVFNLKFYLVILAFIAIELAVLFFEKHVKTFHNLIHHNVKEWRIASFVLIGIGFTYAEISAGILHHTGDLRELLTTVPLKAVFGVFIHTVLTSLGSLIHVGTLLAEGILETVFRFISYYLRIALISISHYVYALLAEHEFSLYILPFITFNLVLFFWAKDYLDKRRGLLPE